jgi:hypothetical protein
VRKEDMMTTQKLHYPISTMTLAPEAGRRPRRARKTYDVVADGMNRRGGDAFAVPTRVGLVAVYVAVAVLTSIALLWH